MGIDQIKYSTNEDVSVSTTETPKDFKAIFNDAISDGKITKEELTDIMARYEEEKGNIGAETQKQLKDMKKEAVMNMLENGYDIRNAKDIENLKNFTFGISDLIISENVINKINDIDKFYTQQKERDDKKEGFLSHPIDGARDFVGYDNITLTLAKDKRTVIEMGILDLNNPFNDNQGKVTKENYNLDKAISADADKKIADEAAKKEAETAAEKVKKELEIVTPVQNVEVKSQEKSKLVEKLGEATGKGNKKDEAFTKKFLTDNFDGINSLNITNEGIKNLLITILKDPNEANVQALQKNLGTKPDGAFGGETLKAIASHMDTK